MHNTLPLTLFLLPAQLSHKLPKLKVLASSSCCQSPSTPLMYPISNHQTNDVICILAELYINRTREEIYQSHSCKLLCEDPKIPQGINIYSHTKTKQNMLKLVPKLEINKK